MSRKNPRKNIGAPPPLRPTATVPARRPLTQIPNGDPRRAPPPQHVSHPPPEHPVGRPPNPRKPQLVRDVRGGALKDMFEIFPDLPRPPRRPARGPVNRTRRGPR
jgi:hypothetical protein